MENSEDIFKKAEAFFKYQAEVYGGIPKDIIAEFTEEERNLYHRFLAEQHPKKAQTTLDSLDVNPIDSKEDSVSQAVISTHSSTEIEENEVIDEIESDEIILSEDRIEDIQSEVNLDDTELIEDEYIPETELEQEVVPYTSLDNPIKQEVQKEPLTPSPLSSELSISHEDDGPRIEQTLEPIYIPLKPISPMQLHNELSRCTTLDELKLLCDKHIDLLRTDLENTNLVFGSGNIQATLMIVGEAPGDNEDKQGQPFVGKAGQLLDKILAAIQLDRNEVYIANILKHRPPKNRDPLPEERDRSLPFLIRQIELVNPKIVLCLGRIAARTLLGLPDSISLGEMRAKFHPFLKDIELTVTYHPSSLMRNPNWKKATWEDVQMVRKRYDEVIK